MFRMPSLPGLPCTRKRALDVGARAYFLNVSHNGKFLAAIANVPASPMH